MFMSTIGTYFFPASVAQQQQRSESGQHMIARSTAIANPIVGPNRSGKLILSTEYPVFRTTTPFFGQATLTYDLEMARVVDPWTTLYAHRKGKTTAVGHDGLMIVQSLRECGQVKKHS